MNYRTDRNNYHQKPKSSNIQTPLEVSWFIYELLKDKIDKKGIIIDPGCGRGNLLEP
jgi:type I restriction-modification system DNA methylase subunit